MLQDWTQEQLNANHTNVDLVSLSLCLRDTLPIQLHSEHVYGHQDRTIPIQCLPLLVRLNIEMDTAAKELGRKVLAYPHMKIHQYHHEECMTQCYWQNQPILHEIKNTLYQKISEDKVKKYWVQKE